jgi:hypothetical protein
LPDCVSDGLARHFATLEELLESPRRMSDAAQRLAQNRATAPLFDLDGYARAFARGVATAWAAATAT